MRVKALGENETEYLYSRLRRFLVRNKKKKKKAKELRTTETVDSAYNLTPDNYILC